MWPLSCFIEKVSLINLYLPLFVGLRYSQDLDIETKKTNKDQSSDSWSVEDDFK